MCRRGSPVTIYGDPPDFDFDSSNAAETAVNAINDALNAETGIERVGESNETGLNIFRIGYDVSGDGITRLTSVWEGVTQDQADVCGSVFSTTTVGLDYG